MINLSKTVFIVDGSTEISSIREKFQKEFAVTCNFRKASCNGKAVSADGYVNKIFPTILMVLNSSFEKVLIILDKEKREVSALTLAVQIKNLLIKKVVETSNFIFSDLDAKLAVIVADIMFENWVVADVEGIKATSLIKLDAQQGHFDTLNGTTILQRIFVGTYKKTTHGPRLFKSVDLNRASGFSPSFSSLLQAINCG